MKHFVLALGMLAAMNDWKQELDATLRQLAPRQGDTLWSWRLTPPLPAQWPPTSNAAPVVQYAYAAGFSPGLRDGERTSAPFARLDIAPDGTTKLTTIATSLEPIAVQGVRPLSAGEAAMLKAPAELLEPARAGQLTSLRTPWCVWKRNNGVVSAHLEKKHPAFFAALQCEQLKGGSTR